MEPGKNILLIIIWIIMYMLAGALFISDAVKYFKNERWFLFGLNSMVSLYYIAAVIKYVILYA